VDWVNLAIALGTILAAGVAYLALRDSRSDRTNKHLNDDIASEITIAVQPLVQQLHDLEIKYKSALDLSISSAVQPLQSQLAVLETKIDVFWRTIAVDAAKILHQPDPRRAMIDDLLEHFMEDRLTSEEEFQLRKYLVTIRNWEPGQDVGFPVHPGEQTAAAILLSTMSHAMSTPSDGDNDDR
jgi:hypothetical protein